MERDFAATIQWLADRAALDELVAAYARAVDTRDFLGWQSLFTEDGGYGNPPHHVPRNLLVEAGERLLAPFSGTQHILGQHSISIDGDAATGRCYFIGIHVKGNDQGAERADVGGWYENSYRRTTQGWRIVKVGGDVVWTAGDDFFAHAGEVLSQLLGPDGNAGS